MKRRKGRKERLGEREREKGIAGKGWGERGEKREKREGRKEEREREREFNDKIKRFGPSPGRVERDRKRQTECNKGTHSRKNTKR
ncbi:hypothetical protein BgiMline_009551, partial [Biomphalaria glabrata]